MAFGCDSRICCFQMFCCMNGLAFLSQRGVIDFGRTSLTKPGGLSACFSSLVRGSPWTSAFTSGCGSTGCTTSLLTLTPTRTTPREVSSSLNSAGYCNGTTKMYSIKKKPLTWVTWKKIGWSCYKTSKTLVLQSSVFYAILSFVRPTMIFPWSLHL